MQIQTTTSTTHITVTEVKQLINQNIWNQFIKGLGTDVLNTRQQRKVDRVANNTYKQESKAKKQAATSIEESCEAAFKATPVKSITTKVKKVEAAKENAKTLKLDPKVEEVKSVSGGKPTEFNNFDERQLAVANERWTKLKAKNAKWEAKGKPDRVISREQMIEACLKSVEAADKEFHGINAVTSEQVEAYKAETEAINEEVKATGILPVYRATSDEDIRKVIYQAEVDRLRDEEE